MTSHLPVRKPSALKVAIVASGLTQRRVSELARIEYFRLVRIIGRPRLATVEEGQRLALLLERPLYDLFPMAEGA